MDQPINLSHCILSGERKKETQNTEVCLLETQIQFAAFLKNKLCVLVAKSGSVFVGQFGTSGPDLMFCFQLF